MNSNFINITKENLYDEHLCCIIRTRKPHRGIDAKQKSWLSDQKFAKSYGFDVVDVTDYGYELLTLSFDDKKSGSVDDVNSAGDETLAPLTFGKLPQFTPETKVGIINDQDLTIYYDMQCPYIPRTVDMIQKYCEENDIPISMIPVDTPEKAKSLPCVFNNFGIFYKGKFETVNLLDMAYLKRILKK